MSLPSGLQTALEQPSFLLFTAYEFDLPGGTVRLLDGENTIVLDGETFTGRDATYGTLGGVESFTDGDSSQAPRCRITFNLPTAAAAAALTDPSVQQSAVSIWWGVLDGVTGAVLGSVLVYTGWVNVPMFKPGQAQRQVELDTASVWDRLLDLDDGARLNNAYTQLVWPGDLGCEFVTRLDKSVEWGTATAGPSGVSYGGGGGGTGFGGGIGLGGLP